MPTTILHFHCLPGPPGTDRVTVLVSPELEASWVTQPLGNFDRNAREWPSVLLGLPGLELIAGGTRLTVTRAAPLRAVEAIEPALWTAIFPASTPVNNRLLSEGLGRPIRSFPAARIAGHLHQLYAEVAAGGGRRLAPVYPEVRKDQQGSLPTSPIDRFVDDIQTAVSNLRERGQWTQEDLTGPYGASDRQRMVDFLRALRFYQRREPGERPPTLDLNDEPTVPELDFHDIVSMLGDHPILLRKLGLVFDVQLPVAIASLPAQGTLQLAITFGSPAPLARCSRTRYERIGGQLRAASRGLGDQADGYLRLEEPALHEVIQVDVDGGALQANDLAVTVRAQQTDVDGPGISETSLPTLRTGGITIVRNGRAARLRDHFNRSDDLESQWELGAELYAEDLVRGYRIDVKEQGQPWRSLCQRHGTIEIAGQRITIPSDAGDEGYVKAMSGTSVPTDPGNLDNTDLYLHEAVASWDGWSLVARRPGRTVRFEKTTPEAHERIETIGNVPGKVRVAAEYVPVPRSLPRLRFGRAYSVRARTVDLTGGGLPVSDPHDHRASAPLVYRRYEPIAPPVTVLRHPITEGASVERLVIRSSVDDGAWVDPDTYAARHAARGYRGDDQRHLLLPKVTLATAEAHGMFDATITNPAASYELACKEAGSVIDKKRIDHRLVSVDVEDLQLHHPPSSLESEPPTWPVKRGDPLRPGEYVTHGGEQVHMPWLPDPLATGFVLWDPATPDGLRPRGVTMPVVTEAGGGWADPRSCRLVLRGTDPGVTDWSIGAESATVAVVKLPPGHMVTLRSSAQPDADRLDHLALFAQLDAAQRGAIEGDVREGRHWMFTPGRDLTLVHAVQRPVTPPTFDGGPYITRLPGETAISFRGWADFLGGRREVDTRLRVHGWSTSHVDVRASWVDLVDDGQHPDGAVRQELSADAFRVPVHYGEALITCDQPVLENRRSVASWPVPHLVNDVKPRTRAARHDLGDTKARTVAYTPVGTTRYQEYFPPALIAERRNLEAAGPASYVSVPSSMRPAPPAVKYVVPTFQWQDTPGGRTRIGGGLRVYLDRPWFQTGAGERLGIVLQHESFDGIGPLVSRWGKDPAWGGDDLPPLATGHFKLDNAKVQFGTEFSFRRSTIARLPLAETGFPVDVIGIVPEWSKARRLWFVDVELDAPQAYWPFVSLALVRVSPRALPGLELSTVVRCDMAQVAPDRAASVTRTGDQVAITLSGVTAGNHLEWSSLTWDGDDLPSWWQPYPDHAWTTDAGHRVYARIERCPGGVDPAVHDLAWETVVGPVELRSHKVGAVEVQWNGVLSLVGITTGGGLRVVLTEAELHRSDEGQPVDLGMDWSGGNRVTAIGRERIVYLDRFAI